MSLQSEFDVVSNHLPSFLRTSGARNDMLGYGRRPCIKVACHKAVTHLVLVFPRQKETHRKRYVD